MYNHPLHQLTLKELKEIDIIGYLSQLGHEPSKICKHDFWYLSPLRTERTPSFKVNKKLNCWYDHGIGKGGNFIDFAMEFYHCTFKGLLQNSQLLPPPLTHFKNPSSAPLASASKNKIISITNLNTFTLLQYLKQRRVPFEIANQYCKEIHYECNHKTYCGIGFKNDAGGYEIRNPFFKGSISPKSITSLPITSDKVIVFEGFMDFLSYQSVHINHPSNPHGAIILNSLSNFEKARTCMESYNTIILYLDRDPAGQNCSQYACSLSNKYKDESHQYKHYKDYNDWIVNFGKTKKNKIGI